VPFTMVIAPGGRVIYQKQGELDIYEFRRAVLANLENDTYVGHPAYWAPGKLPLAELASAYGCAIAPIARDLKKAAACSWNAARMGLRNWRLSFMRPCFRLTAVFCMAVFAPHRRCRSALLAEAWRPMI